MSFRIDGALFGRPQVPANLNVDKLRGCHQTIETTCSPCRPEPSAVTPSGRRDGRASGRVCLRVTRMRSIDRIVNWTGIVTVALLTLPGTGSAQERVRHGRVFPPESIGVLEGPDRTAWQKPDQVMDALGIADGATVADLGAGGGWFTIRLARRVGPNGLVYAEDIQPQMIGAIDQRVSREGLRNTKTVLGTPDDPHLPEGRLDVVLMVDVYQEFENPVTLLKNVARALKPTGRLGIVGFRKDGGGPGPPHEERPEAETVIQEAVEAGLLLLKTEDFLPYQYLLVFGK